jgi:hypothetical protein
MQMQSENRKRTAWRGVVGFLIIWVLLLAGMFIPAAATGQDPSPLWYIPLGAVLALYGLYLLYFRREIAALVKDYGERYSRSDSGMFSWYSSPFFVLVGILFAIVGIYLVVNGVRHL